MPLPLFVLAGMIMPPDTPFDVQIIQEGSRYVLRSFDGARPLYTYDRDQPGKSHCTDACAAAWPPLRVSARGHPAGRWTVLVRPDRSRQWAFDGKPVYTNVHDSDGRATGDGASGTWHLLPTFPAR